jgi:bacteriocin-like protein
MRNLNTEELKQVYGGNGSGSQTASKSNTGSKSGSNTGSKSNSASKSKS